MGRMFVGFGAVVGIMAVIAVLVSLFPSSPSHRYTDAQVETAFRRAGIALSAWNGNRDSLSAHVFFPIEGQFYDHNNGRFADPRVDVDIQVFQAPVDARNYAAINASDWSVFLRRQNVVVEGLAPVKRYRSDLLAALKRLPPLTN